MALSETEAIRLTVLETLALAAATASLIEDELKDVLPIAGVLPADRINRALVILTLTELERAGLAFGYWAGSDAAEHEQQRSDAEQGWAITAAGTAELKRLSDRAVDS